MGVDNDEGVGKRYMWEAQPANLRYGVPPPVICDVTLFRSIILNIQTFQSYLFVGDHVKRKG